jgi:hypothetical protein
MKRDLVWWAWQIFCALVIAVSLTAFLSIAVSLIP